MTFPGVVHITRRLSEELGLQKREYLLEAFLPFDKKSVVELTIAERKDILRRIEEPLHLNAYDEAARLMVECRHRLGLAEKKRAPIFVNELSASELRIDDGNACARAQSEAVRQAKQMGFDATEIKHISIVTLELTQNLLSHAIGGKFSIRFVYSNHGLGLELVSIDSGPAIPAELLNRIISHAHRDAFGNLLGLAIAHKLAHNFSIRTCENRSNQILCQFWVLA